MNIATFLYFTSFWLGLAVNAFPFGETEKECKTMVPSLLEPQFPAQKTKIPFRLTVSQTMYWTDGDVIVSVIATGSEQIRGLQIQARSDECPTPGESPDEKPVGSFSNLPNMQNFKPINCSNKYHSAIINQNGELHDKMEALWTAPQNEKRKIRFHATVIDSSDTYWVGLRSQTIRHVKDVAENDGIECQIVRPEIGFRKPAESISQSSQQENDENSAAKLYNTISTTLVLLFCLLLF